MKEKVLVVSEGIGSPNVNRKIVGDELIFNIERKLNLLSKLELWNSRKLIIFNKVLFVKIEYSWKLLIDFSIKFTKKSHFSLHRL